MLEITKKFSLEELIEAFGGEIPEYHPPEFIQARMNSGYVFLAQVDDKPTGLLIYSIWWGNCPFIELIKIHPEFQRVGIGSQLLDAAKAELKEKGFIELISSTEAINNMGLAFHQKQGFKPLNSLQLPHGEEKFFKIGL